MLQFLRKQSWTGYKVLMVASPASELVGCFIAAPRRCSALRASPAAGLMLVALPAGESVAKYIRQASPYNTQIVALGIDTYLKMLLHDNFVVSPLDAVPQCVVSCQQRAVHTGLSAPPVWGVCHLR